MPSELLDAFYSRYGMALEEGAAALFVGAGLSQPAGFVNWKDLMRGIAKELRLDVDQETDLIAVAQFHVNQFGGRGQLNQLLIEEFTKNAQLTTNHRLIADLPLHTIWTTNYDELLEQAFTAAYKRCDTKTTQQNLVTTSPGRDVVIYKMHGDIHQPDDAVLVKDDYERYDRDHPLFSTLLQGDLISKNFLFLGFSFTDPNIDYILSRIRVILGKNQRPHYCVMRRTSKLSDTPEDVAKYEYEQTKLELRTADLKRFGIQTLLVDDYAEVTEILKELKRHTHRRDVFVSGSAHQYEPLGRERIDNISRLLGQALIKRGYNLISGFGLGIGSAVISGALETAYSDQRIKVNDRVLLRPFPQVAPLGTTRDEFNHKHREEMVSNAGFAVFLCGNKLDLDGRTVVNANGVLEEFQIAKDLGKYPIPIGASGHAAKLIWEEVLNNLAGFYPGQQLRPCFETLGDPQKTDQELVEAVFSVIERTVAK